MGGISEFLSMGGYGAYVWPAYAIVAGVMAGLLIFSFRFVRRSGAELEALNPRARRNRKTSDET